MARDIDYAAIAVQTALAEKFGRQTNLHSVEVTAKERTISIRDADRVCEGTRDELLAAIRAADSLDVLWEILAVRVNSRS